MNLELFKGMDREELLKYLEFLLRNYRLVDAFWFLKVEEAYGRRNAEELNEEVWGIVGSMTLKDLKKYFKIEEKGLEGLEKALRLNPWTNIGDHRITRKDGEILLTAPRCPPQVSRLKRGLGEYDCKLMHQKMFMSTAKEIDYRIKVKCDFAPPDPHPEGVFCRWRFSI
jgi:hypothetical protein